MQCTMDLLICLLVRLACSSEMQGRSSYHGGQNPAVQMGLPPVYYRSSDLRPHLLEDLRERSH